MAATPGRPGRLPPACGARLADAYAHRPPRRALPPPRAAVANHHEQARRPSPVVRHGARRWSCGRRPVASGAAQAPAGTVEFHLVSKMAMELDITFQVGHVVVVMENNNDS